MPKNRITAKEPENSRLPRRRMSENLPGGLYYFEDDLEITGALSANVVTCASWLLEILRLEAGEVSFFVDEKEIRPHLAQMAIFYPPFTITRLYFRKVKASVKGIAGTDVPVGGFSKKPLVFQKDFAESLESAANAAEILKSARNIQFVEAHPKASLLSLKAKRLIDENYQIFPSIARIAARLGVSHEHLTRQFKRDFRLTPSKYLHKLRIADASFRLLQGERIIEVSGEVGYNDLSRFYKQFRESTAHSPGFCKASK